MLTKDGKAEIKKEYETSKEHSQDMANLVDNARDNFAATKVKDFLQDTKAGRKILEGLKANPTSVQYQEVIKATVIKKLEFLGLDISKVNIAHYSAKESKNTLLADIKNVVDVQGLTITKGKDTGTILLDASGNENNKSNKAQDVKVAGHEAGEIKYLQNGNGLIFKDSYDTKEAMNDSSGNSFYNRLNEAANGNLTDVTCDSKSNNYVNAGTIYSNNVQTQENGIEFRKLALIEKDFINKNASMFASQNSFTPFLSKTGAQPMKLSKAHKILTEAANYLVDKSSNNKTKYRLESVVNPGEVTRKELHKGIEFLQKQSEGIKVNDFALGENGSQQIFTATDQQYKDSSLDIDSNVGIQPTLLGGAEILTPIGRILKTVHTTTKTISPVFINSGKKVLNKADNVFENVTLGAIRKLNDVAPIAGNVIIDPKKSITIISGIDIASDILTDINPIPSSTKAIELSTYKNIYIYIQENILDNNDELIDEK